MQQCNTRARARPTGSGTGAENTAPRFYGRGGRWQKIPPVARRARVLLPPVWTGLTGVASSNDGRAGASGPVPSCYEPSDRPRRRGHLEIMQVPGRADSSNFGPGWPSPKIGMLVRRGGQNGVAWTSPRGAWRLHTTSWRLAPPRVTTTSTARRTLTLHASNKQSCQLAFVCCVFCCVHDGIRRIARGRDGRSA